MKLLTFLRRGVLPPLVAITACSKLPADVGNEGANDSGTGIVSVDFGTKSLKCDIRNCLMFALDESGKVIKKDSCLCSRKDDAQEINWILSSGTYRIWCIVNCDGTTVEKLRKCENSAEIENVAFPADGLDRNSPLSLLTVGGEDLAFSLAAGENRKVSVTGKPLTAKICLRNIVNQTSCNTLPAYGPVPIKCLEAVLLNVPDSMAVADSRKFELRNCTSDKKLDLMDACTCAKGSELDILPGNGNEENITLYCFPNSSCEQKLILSVCMCLADEYVRWYNIPIGTVTSGCEYTVSNLVVLKEGAPTPFVLTPTGEFTTGTSVCRWEFTMEDGLDGIGACGEMKFGMNHVQVFRENLPDEWTCDFENLYGPASVLSSHPERVSATGAGKHWWLHALKEGHSVLTLNDGCNEMQVPVCVGPSIKCSWKDCDGNAWNPLNPLYTYQCCRLSADSHYGTLHISTDGSMFTLMGNSDEGILAFTHPGGSKEVSASDHFETRTVSFPYKILDWDIAECPLIRLGEDGIVKNGEFLSVSMALPFSMKESAITPELRVEDPGNNVDKARITISTALNDRYFSVSAKTGCLRNMTDLDIGIYCRFGEKERKIMSINTCKTF